MSVAPSEAVVGDAGAGLLLVVTMADQALVQMKKWALEEWKKWLKRDVVKRLNRSNKMRKRG